MKKYHLFWIIPLLEAYKKELETNKKRPGNDERYHGEAKGWYPETWSDNKNLLNTLINITGDKQLETELAGLQNNLL